MLLPGLILFSLDPPPIFQIFTLLRRRGREGARRVRFSPDSALALA